ncbi:conserved hypothetical cytosolic protein [Parvibaculum lavamentivorans DS-1]|uniref:Conserved hypothetical cytosolic protein n=1 Tax=Parvibaculum lavamentivorans (strain DS-1 / DSM 13023 / NCIMB 13966) TaxID=402881 RepID=A7HX95_PARL1|nr:DUF177 domain-containing protein [Parvibaculum lavamentivorans]ABS64528.1 conserved hypothetical cytosolic protein [Parvibaculum lavamentivorans DS-1]
MTLPDTEFSQIVTANEVPPNGTEIKFVADVAALKALAQRYDVLEVTRLAGTGRVRPYRKAGLTLECAFEAEVIQACVVTLDPVRQSIAASFTQRYLPAHMIEPEALEPGIGAEVTIDIEAEDAPEPMTGNAIDVGEAVAEQLALAIDPYPRKQGVAFEAPPEGEEDASEIRPNPFAALEKLKKNY